jgi:hypothetical protein
MMLARADNRIELEHAIALQQNVARQRHRGAERIGVVGELAAQVGDERAERGGETDGVVVAAQIVVHLVEHRLVGVGDDVKRVRPPAAHAVEIAIENVEVAGSDGGRVHAVEEAGRDRARGAVHVGDHGAKHDARRLRHVVLHQLEAKAGADAVAVRHVGRAGIAVADDGNDHLHILLGLLGGVVGGLHG